MIAKISWDYHRGAKELGFLFWKSWYVSADTSLSVATADPAYWELEDFECFSGKVWEGGFIKINDESQQPIQAIGTKSMF